MNGGVKATFKTRVTDSDDKLIVQHGTRSFEWLKRYDRWRIPYCNRNRRKKLWLSFREGKVGLNTLIYALILRIKGG